jgi:hypothetical protein
MLIYALPSGTATVFAPADGTVIVLRSTKGVTGGPESIVGVELLLAQGQTVVLIDPAGVVPLVPSGTRISLGDSLMQATSSSAWGVDPIWVKMFLFQSTGDPKAYFDNSENYSHRLLLNFDYHCAGLDTPDSLVFRDDAGFVVYLK